NIRFGGTGRENLLTEVIGRTRPDIVVLQEATSVDVVKRFAENNKELKHWAAKPGHSVAFLSRLEIEHYEWHYDRVLQRPFMEIVPAGTNLRIFGIHLRATHSNYTERGRMREVRALLERIKEYREGFHLLIGDFNTLAPNELLDMQRLPWRYRVLAWALGGHVTYRTIQIMLDEGYIDSYRTLNTDPGFTFPTWDPHVRLDYVFVPTAYADRVKSCKVVTDFPEAAKASDHFPLLAEIDANT
ncbi:MAG TPA: endonuclease/exonuclease/phosphatase family protein, partial [Pyrinomonadaceae bacterium]|nr:endonuclease/exonuclease/phosphatase family protein [Pyrinomonadaceae bacterium]